MLESSQSPAWSPKAEVLIECSLDLTQISSLHPPKAWLVLKSTWNLSKSSKHSRWIMGTHQTHDTTELASFSPKNQKCLSFFLQFSFARSTQTLWEIFSAFSLLVWIDTAQRNQLQPGERNTHLANNTEKRQGWKWEMTSVWFWRQNEGGFRIIIKPEAILTTKKWCFQVRIKWFWQPKKYVSK